MMDWKEPAPTTGDAPFSWSEPEAEEDKRTLVDAEEAVPPPRGDQQEDSWSFTVEDDPTALPTDAASTPTRKFILELQKAADFILGHVALLPARRRLDRGPDEDTLTRLAYARQWTKTMAKVMADAFRNTRPESYICVPTTAAFVAMQVAHVVHKSTARRGQKTRVEFFMELMSEFAGPDPLTHVLAPHGSYSDTAALPNPDLNLSPFVFIRQLSRNLTGRDWDPSKDPYLACSIRSDLPLSVSSRGCTTEYLESRLVLFAECTVNDVFGQLSNLRALKSTASDSCVINPIPRFVGLFGGLPELVALCRKVAAGTRPDPSDVKMLKDAQAAWPHLSSRGRVYPLGGLVVTSVIDMFERDEVLVLPSFLDQGNRLLERIAQIDNTSGTLSVELADRMKGVTDEDAGVFAASILAEGDIVSSEPTLDTGDALAGWISSVNALYKDVASSVDAVLRKTEKNGPDGTPEQARLYAIFHSLATGALRGILPK